MRKIFLFMNTSLDGYYAAPDGSLDGFHHRDDRFEAFQAEQSRVVDTILLGRKTYEMMRSFWPTEQAASLNPGVAEFMNSRTKVVVTRQSGYQPGWQNVQVIGTEVMGEVRRLKDQPGGEIIIMGSNDLSRSLVQAKLIDELQILVNPVLLGNGLTLFQGLAEIVELKLVGSQAFPSGKILLTYQ
jgi:dihydrofolate reductase